jgi:F-type H+-transporting ATPase subunit epsilon
LLASLDVGEVSYRVGGERHFLAVSGGFAEVLRDKVTILAETCERAEEIDVARAEKSKERAAEVLKGKAEEREFRNAEIRLRRALSRIRVSGRSSG